MSKDEAEYKRNWIELHDKADVLTYDPKTNQPVSALYNYPPYAHIKEVEDLFAEVGLNQNTGDKSCVNQLR
jgi:hypothetical protein